MLHWLSHICDIGKYTFYDLSYSLDKFVVLQLTEK